MSSTDLRPPAGLTMQEVSRRTGLSEATLRYYERIGLIAAVARDPSSGHRRFRPETADTLESLACLRAAGMGVEDMRRYLALLERGREAAAQQRELFATHAGRLSAEIAQLQLRLAYLERKAELWDARDRGDAEAERAAVERITDVTAQF